MKYVYLDNLRGFSDTFVPLADVNFLVGENSTGKTSFMNVLRMLSASWLLTGQEAYGDEIQLGGFAELVSAHSKDHSYFRLGFIADATFRNRKESGKGEHREQKKRRAYAILLTYKNVGGLSKLACFTCTMLDYQITLLFDEEEVHYRIDSAPVSESAEEMKPHFLNLIQHHKNIDKHSCKILKSNIAAEHGHYPLMYLIVQVYEKAKDEKKSFELSMPPMAPDIVWIAPIRSRPRRTYDEPQTAFSSEGAHIPYVIRRVLSSKSEAQKFRTFMKAVGEASGLFEKIDIKHFGARGGEAGRFQVDAYLDKKALGLHLMGYGVSQSLPILVELLIRPENSWFGIQQPEVHLHPRAQAALGDVFFEMAVKDSKKFLIETHSDFTIDRFRLNYRKKRKTKTVVPKGQILFFERRNQKNIVSALPIEKNGELPSDQPESYRRFFIREQMKLLGVS